MRRETFGPPHGARAEPVGPQQSRDASPTDADAQVVQGAMDARAAVALKVPGQESADLVEQGPVLLRVRALVTRPPRVVSRARHAEASAERRDVVCGVLAWMTANASACVRRRTGGLFFQVAREFPGFPGGIARPEVSRNL